MPTTPPFDRFVKYPELTELLAALAAEYPEFLELTSIGKSFEGRDIWLATVTNRATGLHSEKPAFWVDANIHATELTGSVAALHLVHRLCAGYGTDPDITRALDTRCFYVVPRLNPDGAELAMAERPTYVRSSTRPYPRTDQQDGLVPEDIDGDGRILTMRIPDPNGNWKPYHDDPRLLVARDPEEDGAGPYYRLLPEGKVQGWDGMSVSVAPALHGLDMNRNFPIDWRPEGQQTGAGPFPTSEPEIRAAVEAITERTNICGYVAYHTYSGVHLRPYGNKADDELPTFDLRVFKRIGEKATSLTGYPAISVYHEFRYDPKDVITGVADDWAYDHLGVVAWTTEFWSPMRAAGIEDFKYIDWFFDHPLDDDLKMLAWADENLGGRGYVDWYEYDHPQFGRVELGGWNSMLVFRGPPVEKMEAEVAPHTDWAIWHCLISPLLRHRETQVEALGDGGWRVRVAVENTGWLPTNVTEKAIERKAVRPLEATVTAPDGVEVVTKPRVELGQLSGRALKHSTLSWGGSDVTSDRAVAEWVVRGPAGATLDVEFRHQRAGVVRTTVALG